MLLLFFILGIHSSYYVKKKASKGKEEFEQNVIESKRFHTNDNAISNVDSTNRLNEIKDNIIVQNYSDQASTHNNYPIRNNFSLNGPYPNFYNEVSSDIYNHYTENVDNDNFQFNNFNRYNLDNLDDYQDSDMTPLDLSVSTNWGCTQHTLPTSKGNSHYNTPHVSHNCQPNPYITSLITFEEKTSPNRYIYDYKPEFSTNTTFSSNINNGILETRNLNTINNESTIPIKDIAGNVITNIPINETFQYSYPIGYFENFQKELDLQIICRVDGDNDINVTYLNDETLNLFPLYITEKYTNEEKLNTKFLENYSDICFNLKSRLNQLNIIYYTNLRNKNYSLVFYSLIEAFKLKLEFINNKVIYNWVRINFFCGTTYDPTTDVKIAIQCLQNRKIFNDHIQNLFLDLYRMGLAAVHYTYALEIVKNEQSKLDFIDKKDKDLQIFKKTKKIRNLIYKSTKKMKYVIKKYHSIFKSTNINGLSNDIKRIKIEMELAKKKKSSNKE